MSAQFVSTTEFLSWGRTARHRHDLAQPIFRDELGRLASLEHGGTTKLLAVGLGRSYGDSCLNADGRLIDMSRLDRLIAFDPATGVLRAESGLSLNALLRFCVPRGWFVPVTPGTRFVTLGGAVANDVHGKNHHSAGTFGRHVRGLRLRRSDGASEIGPAENTEVFEATVGGLGLTGILEWVELALTPIRSSFLQVETLPFAGLDEFAAIAAESERDWPYTVAWVDCSSSGNEIGRGIFSRALFEEDSRFDVHRHGGGAVVPFEAPSFLLNRMTLSTFNRLYYQLNRWRRGRRRSHYEPFFYPLDRIRHWNRLYGQNGMYQYQCVVPPGDAIPAVREMLRIISAAGDGSFLAVLKTFGSLASSGLLSFPREGTTLALDFRNRGKHTLNLLSQLDGIVRTAGGRLYAAKDGRMPAEMFRRGYPDWDRFSRFVDPSLRSDFWRRVSA